MNNLEKNREINRRIGQFMNGFRAVDTSRLVEYFSAAELAEIKTKMEDAGLLAVQNILYERRPAEKGEKPTLPTTDANDQGLLATFINPRLRRMLIAGKAGLDGTWDKVHGIFAVHGDWIVEYRDYYDLDVSPGWLEREYESDKEWMKS